MLRTVIFDMDGVIVDTEPVHRYAYYQHFNELGIEVPEEMYTSFTGFSTKNTYQKVKEHYEIPQEVDDLVLRKRTLFNEAFDTKPDLELIEGVRDLIVHLHQQDIELILGSSASKSTIHRVFNRFELFPYFTHIVSGEDFPQSKPDPAIFIEAASLAKIKAKEHCLVIEDSTNGIKAANAAGIKVLGYQSLNSKQQDYRTADFVIKSFLDIDAKHLAQLFV
ncbi:HAD family hydrolase [Myroides sp. DW712]|uniref:HAD family hydrolase n=1 Tax=Myroides sp. DW712 TaxID=3389800 RepID=UPI00397D85F2